MLLSMATDRQAYTADTALAMQTRLPAQTPPPLDSPRRHLITACRCPGSSVVHATGSGTGTPYREDRTCREMSDLNAVEREYNNHTPRAVAQEISAARLGRRELWTP